MQFRLYSFGTGNTPKSPCLELVSGSLGLVWNKRTWSQFHASQFWGIASSKWVQTKLLSSI